MIPCGHWCTPPRYRYGNIFCLNFLLIHNRSDQKEAPPYSQIKDWNLEWFTRHCETAGSSVCFHPSVYLSLAVYIACVCKKNVAFLMVDKSGFSQRPSIYGVGRVRLTWIAGGLLDSNWIMRGGQKSIELCCHWESMQAEWMSYTRLYCPAGHKYSPLPVDNWWQKRWLAGSQANPVQPGWKKSLWHRNSLGPSPHSTQGQLFLQSDWIQFTSGDNHRCHRRHPLPLNGIKSLIVSAILAHSCELCASSKPHFFIQSHWWLISQTQSVKTA